MPEKNDKDNQPKDTGKAKEDGKEVPPQTTENQGQRDSEGTTQGGAGKGAGKGKEGAMTKPKRVEFARPQGPRITAGLKRKNKEALQYKTKPKRDFPRKAKVIGSCRAQAHAESSYPPPTWEHCMRVNARYARRMRALPMRRRRDMEERWAAMSAETREQWRRTFESILAHIRLLQGNVHGAIGDPAKEKEKQKEEEEKKDDAEE